MRLFRRIKQQILIAQCEPILHDIRGLYLDLKFEGDKKEENNKEAK